MKDPKRQSRHPILELIGDVDCYHFQLDMSSPDGRIGSGNGSGGPNGQSSGAAATAGGSLVYSNAYSGDHPYRAAAGCGDPRAGADGAGGQGYGRSASSGRPSQGPIIVQRTTAVQPQVPNS